MKTLLLTLLLVASAAHAEFVFSQTLHKKIWTENGAAVIMYIPEKGGGSFGAYILSFHATDGDGDACYKVYAPKTHRTYLLKKSIEWEGGRAPLP